jgi:hypothetical protein
VQTQLPFFPEGETVKIELAERGVLLESIPLKGGSKKEIWCREVRKRSESGHQKKSKICCTHPKRTRD